MDRFPWNKIEQELEEYTAVTGTRDEESFWREFKNRAVDVGQNTSTDVAPGLRLVTWLKVAACIALASSILVLTLSKDNDVPVVRNKIKNLEVFASYSAMIILDDDKSEGTIVWLTDLTND